MNAALWVLIAIVVIAAVVAAFVVIRMRQRSGTIVAARPASGAPAGRPADPGPER